MKTKGCGTAMVVNPVDLEAMATAGMTPAEIGRYYGLTKQGMVRVVNNNPELKEAFHNGLNHVLVKCVRVLVDKLEKGDTFAAIYLLNNRFKWCEERFRKEKEVTDQPRVMIYLPENFRDSPDNETIIESE